MAIPAKDPIVDPTAPLVAAAISDPAAPPPVAGQSGEVDPPVISPDAPIVPPAKPAAQAKDWKDDRIATLTGKLREAQEKLAVVPKADPEAPLDANAEFNRQVKIVADQTLAAKEFADKCTSEAAKGRSQWTDFDDRLNDLRGLVNTSDPTEVAQYNALLAAGIETGELAMLVYELGQDPAEALRVMKLPPLKMGVELTKKALAGAKIEPLSQVAKPATPLLGGRGEQVPIDPADADNSDRLTTAEWMTRRERQIAASYAARNGRA